MTPSNYWDRSGRTYAKMWAARSRAVRWDAMTDEELEILLKRLDRLQDELSKEK